MRIQSIYLIRWTQSRLHALTPPREPFTNPQCRPNPHQELSKSSTSPSQQPIQKQDSEFLSAPLAKGKLFDILDGKYPGIKKMVLGSCMVSQFGVYRFGG